MDPGRLVALAVALVIVGVTLASGAVGIVPAPAEPWQSDPGTGNATVEVVDAPETVTFEQGVQDTHSLSVPPMTVRVSALRGNPVLTYTLEIDQLGVSTSSVHPLEPMGEGESDLETEPRSFESDRIANVSTATVRLVLRGGSEGTQIERTLFESTVEVRHE